MSKGSITIYSGDGRGKSPAALGRAVMAAADGKQVVLIQFLKGHASSVPEIIKRMEPEIKFFCFEKATENYETLDEEARREESINIQNGIQFARKVLSTGECDLLILDEFLGLAENNLITIEQIQALLDLRGETDVILTGINLPDDICVMADEVSKINTVRFKVFNSEKEDS